MRRTLALAALTALIGVGAGLAQHHDGAHHGKQPAAAPPPAQPYAGQQARKITSLSADDIQGYLEGRGMGFAKPAELLGYPGPMHVLELDKELALSDDQRRRVKASMDAVKTKARALGRQYVDAEAAVDEAFRADAGENIMTQRVATAGNLLNEIRMAHLAAHLEITPLLSASQRKTYAELRGYSGAAADGDHHKKH